MIKKGSAADIFTSHSLVCVTMHPVCWHSKSAQTLLTTGQDSGCYALIYIHWYSTTMLRVVRQDQLKLRLTQSRHEPIDTCSNWVWVGGIQFGQGCQKLPASARFHATLHDKTTCVKVRPTARYYAFVNVTDEAMQRAQPQVSHSGGGCPTVAL